MVVNVTFHQRKPRAGSDHSVENVFVDVRQSLDGKVNSRTVICPFESRGVLRRLANMASATLRQGDVNHVTGDVNYIGIFLPRSRTVQTILDCRHLMRSTGIRHLILKTLWVTLPIRNCAYVTVISDSTRKELLRHVKCDPTKVSVIPVGVSPRFKSTPKVFNKKAPVVLQLGTAKNKNVSRLVGALKGTECRLEVVGKWDPSLARDLSRAEIPHRFRSGLSSDEIVQCYQDADIVTLVSTLEGFGMPIVEAQAVGRVVVASNVSSMPEVAGDAACLVAPLDVGAIRAGIRKVIDDDHYREDLIRRGFENVKRFDPDQIAQKYLALYNRVANSRPPVID